MADAPPSSAELLAVAKHLIVRCYDAMKPYLAVAEKYEHPLDRTPEAPAVLRCAHTVVSDAKREAPEAFKAYVDCVSYYSLKAETTLQKCRAEQKAFEAAFPLSKKQ